MALPNTQIAMCNLPLYSKVQQGADVTKPPQRAAAVTAIHRCECETPANPPPGTGIGHSHQARQHLRVSLTPSPYVGMMELYAMRAGNAGHTKARGHSLQTDRRRSRADSLSEPHCTSKKRSPRHGTAPAGVPLPPPGHLAPPAVNSARRDPRQLLLFLVGSVEGHRSSGAAPLLPHRRLSHRSGKARHAATEWEVMRHTGHTRTSQLSSNIWGLWPPPYSGGRDCAGHCGPVPSPYRCTPVWKTQKKAST